MAVRIAHGAGSAGRQPSGARRRRLLTFGLALTAVLALSWGAFAPAAEAFDPLSWVGAAVHVVTGGVGSVAVAAFDAIVKSLFAPIAKFVTTELVGWLIAVPNFMQGSVAQLESTVVAMGGGLLGAVATIATLRYWVAGFAGGGDAGFAALEGLARTVAAALCLAIWPWLFDSAVGLTNLFTQGLLGSPGVVNDTAKLLADGLGASVALGAGGLGLFVAIVIAAGACLLFLGLLLLKIAVSVSTVLVFVGMPMALVLWPLAPWVARLAMRAFMVCLAVPALWALCFAASAAVNVNVLGFQGGGGVFDTLLQPLVAIVLLWVMLRLPFALARVAMLGGAALSGGFVARAASYAAGAQVRETVRQHVGALGGGSSGQSRGGGSPTDSRTAGRLRSAAVLAGAAASGGASVPVTGAPASGGGARTAGSAGAGAASGGVAARGGGAGVAAGGVSSPTAGAGTAANGTRYTPPASARAHAAGWPAGGGLQTPGFREQDFQAEVFEARYRQRTNPVSVEQASEALRALPESTRRGVGELVAEQGAGAREHLAYQATGEWTAGEREALRTLAAAAPDTRARAIDGVLAGASRQSEAGASDASAAARADTPIRGGGAVPAADPAREGARLVVDAGDVGRPASPGTPASPGAPTSPEAPTSSATPAVSASDRDPGGRVVAGDPEDEVTQWVGTVDAKASSPAEQAPSLSESDADPGPAVAATAGEVPAPHGNGTRDNGAPEPPHASGPRSGDTRAAGKGDQAAGAGEGGQTARAGEDGHATQGARGVPPVREPRNSGSDVNDRGGS